MAATDSTDISDAPDRERYELSVDGQTSALELLGVWEPALLRSQRPLSRLALRAR